MNNYFNLTQYKDYRWSKPQKCYFNRNHLKFHNNLYLLPSTTALQDYPSLVNIHYTTLIQYNFPPKTSKNATPRLCSLKSQNLPEIFSIMFVDKVSFSHLARAARELSMRSMGGHWKFRLTSRAWPASWPVSSSHRFIASLHVVGLPADIVYLRSTPFAWRAFTFFKRRRGSSGDTKILRCVCTWVWRDAVCSKICVYFSTFSVGTFCVSFFIKYKLKLFHIIS